MFTSFYELDTQSRGYKPTKGINGFKPFSLRPNSEDIESMTPLSQIEEFNSIRSLVKRHQIWCFRHMELERLFSLRELTFPWRPCNARFKPWVFNKGENFDTVIKQAITILEQFNLSPKHMIPVLAVLRHLRGYLPKRGLDIMDDMKKGPIGYAALQLHLTRGIE